MDIEYLREYLTVASELNFTRSAKTLNTTQSTLSKHVAALEREFGAELLTRGGKAVELTQAGTLLYRRARTIVSEYDAAQSEVRKLAESPNVRVGGMLANGEVISLLSKATALLKAQEHPSALLTTVATEPFHLRLVHKEVDVVLCHSSAEFDDDPGLACRHIFRSPFMLVVEKDHPLAQRRSVDIPDLKDYPLVQLIGEYASAGWGRIREVCQAYGFEPRKYPIVANNAIDCLTEPLGDAILIVTSSLFPGGALPYEDFCTIMVEDDLAFFQLNAYYRVDDETRLSGFLAVLEQAGAQVQAGLSTLSRPASSRPFQTRCRLLAQAHDVNETELEAMIQFAKGRSLDRIAANMGMTRLMVGDLLGNVYRKVGVSDKQDLLDAIEAMRIE